jgi:cold shock CspA family protein
LEINDIEVIGKHTATCKWFNDKLGFGFITICSGEDKGKDIFVHHSGIKPLNSIYKTLKKGEYINFNIINGLNGLQAVDVTGINGGPLMCDHVIGKKTYDYPHQGEIDPSWQQVPVNKRAPNMAHPYNPSFAPTSAGVDANGRPQQRNDRHERPDRQERPDRHERPDRQERHERPDRQERQERPDRQERPERPDRQERPERVPKTPTKRFPPNTRPYKKKIAGAKA